jgi:hypothetical protein
MSKEELENETPSDSVEEAWIREADRRAEQVLRGEVELVAGDEVVRKALVRIRATRDGRTASDLDRPE